MVCPLLSPPSWLRWRCRHDRTNATTQKRLGDGFYEQKLIREQVSQLTGRRFLDGYASDEAQYQALMGNAATYAQAYNLRPGIALTAAQMSALTSDMVWLVEKTVTLPNGQTTQALVPQLYARVQDGDPPTTGALIYSGLNYPARRDKTEVLFASRSSYITGFPLSRE